MTLIQPVFCDEASILQCFNRQPGVLQTAFHNERERILAQLPPQYPGSGVVGWFVCAITKVPRPVQVLSPYDVPPGPWRRAWMEAFVKWQRQQQQSSNNPAPSTPGATTSRSMPLLLYLLDGGDGAGDDSHGGDNTNIRRSNSPKAVSDTSSDNTYSCITLETFGKFVSYEEGRARGYDQIPKHIQQKLIHEEALTDADQRQLQALRTMVQAHDDADQGGRKLPFGRPPPDDELFTLVPVSALQQRPPPIVPTGNNNLNGTTTTIATATANDHGQHPQPPPDGVPTIGTRVSVGYRHRHGATQRREGTVREHRGDFARIAFVDDDYDEWIPLWKNPAYEIRGIGAEAALRRVSVVESGKKGQGAAASRNTSSDPPPAGAATKTTQDASIMRTTTTEPNARQSTSTATLANNNTVASTQHPIESTTTTTTKEGISLMEDSASSTTTPTTKPSAAAMAVSSMRHSTEPVQDPPESNDQSRPTTAQTIATTAPPPGGEKMGAPAPARIGGAGKVVGEAPQEPPVGDTRQQQLAQPASKNCNKQQQPPAWRGQPIVEEMHASRKVSSKGSNFLDHHKESAAANQAVSSPIVVSKQRQVLANGCVKSVVPPVLTAADGSFVRPYFLEGHFWNSQEGVWVPLPPSSAAGSKKRNKSSSGAAKITEKKEKTLSSKKRSNSTSSSGDAQAPAKEAPKKKPKPKRPKDHPKKSIAAYNFFFKDERERIYKIVQAEDGTIANNNNNPESEEYISPEKKQTLKFENGKVRNKEVTKLVGERWRKLDTARRAHYAELAAADKERYSKEMVIYRDKLALSHASANADSSSPSGAKKREPPSGPPQQPCKRQKAAAKANDGSADIVGASTASISKSASMIRDQALVSEQPEPCAPLKPSAAAAAAATTTTQPSANDAGRKAVNKSSPTRPVSEETLPPLSLKQEAGSSSPSNTSLEKGSDILKLKASLESELDNVNNADAALRCFQILRSLFDIRFDDEVKASGICFVIKKLKNDENHPTLGNLAKRVRVCWIADRETEQWKEALDKLADCETEQTNEVLDHALARVKNKVAAFYFYLEKNSFLVTELMGRLRLRRLVKVTEVLFQQRKHVDLFPEVARATLEFLDGLKVLMTDAGD